MGGGFFAGFTEFVLQWRAPLALAVCALFLSQLGRVPAARRLYTAAMALYFFLIIVAYWILKPLKKAAFIAHYKTSGSAFGLEPAQMELLAKEVNVAVALLAVLGLVWLRRRFAASGYALAVILPFALLLALLILWSDQESAGFVWAFYLYGDVYVSSLVALFFATLHDHSSMTDARRIYGLVGLGGVLGGLAGSVAAGELGKAVGVSGAMQVSLVLTLGVALLAWQVGRGAARRPYEDAEIGLEPRDNRSIFHGALVIRHSKPLILIAGVLLMYEIASVVLDYQFTSVVSRSLATEELKSYFSAVYSFSNAMAIVVQLLLTSWVLKRFGAGVALFIMPAAALLASGMFLVLPVLLTASLLNTADGAFAYSIQQTARESLYVPLGRREKYEAKAFLDIVWLRFAKGLAVLLSLGLSLMLPSGQEAWLSLVVLGLAAIWLTVLHKIAPPLEPASTAHPQAAIL